MQVLSIQIKKKVKCSKIKKVAVIHKIVDKKYKKSNNLNDELEVMYG